MVLSSYICTPPQLILALGLATVKARSESGGWAAFRRAPSHPGESHLEISDSNCAQARRAGFESCEAGTAPIPRFQLEIEPAPNAIALPREGRAESASADRGGAGRQRDALPPREGRADSRLQARAGRGGSATPKRASHPRRIAIARAHARSCR